LVVEQNPAVIRTHETGDQIQSQGLAGSTWSKEDGDACGCLKLQLQRKRSGVRPAGKCFAEPGVDHLDGII